MRVDTNSFSNWLADPREHLVEFYKTERSLLRNLRDYLLSGLDKNDTCVVIVKPLHMKKLLQELKKCTCVSFNPYDNDESLKIINAESVLNSFMVGGHPDKKKFFASIGTIVEKASSNGRSIRAYGEMVALLWEEGNKEGAIELENLWNQLSKKYEFSLYCAYPDMLFKADNGDRAMVDRCHNLSLLPDDPLNVAEAPAINGAIQRAPVV